MIAALSLEKFETSGRFAGYLGFDKSNPWVARLVGLDDQFGFAREFVRAQADYSNASGTGGRGIMLRYALVDGIYEVNERVSWKRVNRYFVRAKDGRIEKISCEQVLLEMSEPLECQNEHWD